MDEGWGHPHFEKAGKVHFFRHGRSLCRSRRGGSVKRYWQAPAVLSAWARRLGRPRCQSCYKAMKHAITGGGK